MAVSVAFFQPKVCGDVCVHLLRSPVFFHHFSLRSRSISGTLRVSGLLRDFPDNVLFAIFQSAHVLKSESTPRLVFVEPVKTLAFPEEKVSSRIS